MNQKASVPNSFYGHGKVLLSSEYFILDGALALSLPCKLGQRLKVRHRPSFNPRLVWKSYDFEGRNWLNASFEFWRFDIIDGNQNCPHTLFIQKVLRQARKQNPHFLRDDYEVNAEAISEFPLSWGLGSSSSLIYNIAHWAYTSAFEINKVILNGSGYDVASAGANGPIQYQLKKKGPTWSPVSFHGRFQNKLFFLYQGAKKSTQSAIEYYKESAPEDKKHIIKELSGISRLLLETEDFMEFSYLLKEHEMIISNSLKLERLQEQFFSDFPGVVKSLGAWGGDFALVASPMDEDSTREYFKQKGFQTLIPYHELIFDNSHTQVESFELGLQ